MANFNERESNVELLRILAMLAVVFLHHNNYAFLYVGGGETVNSVLLYLSESICICAVDLFMLISGYFMAKSCKRSLWKVLELIVQVIIFQTIIYLANCALGEQFSIKHFIRYLLPGNYFVVLYCVVYMFSPYLSKALDALDRKNLDRLFVLSVVIFSIYPTLLDVAQTIGGFTIEMNTYGRYGDQMGYSVLTFFLSYFIGCYLRITDWKLSKRKCLIGLAVLTVLMFGYEKGMTYAGAEFLMAYSYCNPIIFGEAILLFVLFKQMNMGSSKIINTLAKGSFTVYLASDFFFQFIGIENCVALNPILMYLRILCSLVFIYLLCFVLYKIYNVATSHLWKWLKNNVKLPEIGIS